MSVLSGIIDSFIMYGTVGFDGNRFKMLWGFGTLSLFILIPGIVFTILLWDIILEKFKENKDKKKDKDYWNE